MTEDTIHFSPYSLLAQISLSDGLIHMTVIRCISLVEECPTDQNLNPRSITGGLYRWTFIGKYKNMSFSMKTRSKMLKAQFVHAMTKNRYMGNHPRTKRFILGSFATLVIGYAGFNISLSVPEISVKWESEPVTYEQRAQAKFEAKEEVVKELTIEEKIAKAFPENPMIMKAIAQAESGLNPLASHKNTNGSVDIGLFQINSIHGKDQLELFDVDHNIEVARQVYEKQGLGAWVAFTNGSYLKFIK